MSTRVRGEAARERIVAAAERLLRERAYRELSVEQVMAEARLSRTIFYRHFDSLAGVVAALLADIEAELFPVLEAEPMEDVLRAAVDDVRRSTARSCSPSRRRPSTTARSSAPTASWSSASTPTWRARCGPPWTRAGSRRATPGTSRGR